MKTTTKIITPFDAHLHLREGKMMETVLPFTLANCQAAVIMGNLKNPIDDIGPLIRYRSHILRVAEFHKLSFVPIMTIMLTPNTTIDHIKRCAGEARAIKMIPANASTNSQQGVSLDDLPNFYHVLAEVEKQGMIFSIHAERIVNKSGKIIPEPEREKYALPDVEKIIKDFPGLRLIVEHVSTKEACQLVMDSPTNVAGTITAHHSLLNERILRNIDGDLQPEYYCKPVLKKEPDREFVNKMMLSGSPKFFFGSDSAPHPWEKKFGVAEPAAGIFSGWTAIPMIVEEFMENGRWGNMEYFLSVAGRNFYGLPTPDANEEYLMLYNFAGEVWKPSTTVGEERIPVLCGERRFSWQMMRNGISRLHD